MERRTITLTAIGLTLGGVLAGDTARAADSTAAPATERGVYDRRDLRNVDDSGLPATTTITARDGTSLAVRVYPSGAGTPTRSSLIAIGW